MGRVEQKYSGLERGTYSPLGEVAWETNGTEINAMVHIGFGQAVKCLKYWLPRQGFIDPVVKTEVWSWRGWETREEAQEEVKRYKLAEAARLRKQADDLELDI